MTTNIKKLLIPTSVVLLLAAAALWAYLHRRTLFPSLSFKLAVIHMNNVDEEQKPYFLEQEEVVANGAETHTTSIIIARRSDGAEGGLNGRDNVLMRGLGKRAGYRKADLTFWLTGQKVYYRSDTNTKQTYNFDPNSDSWKSKAIMRWDPSANCLARYDGSSTVEAGHAVSSEDLAIPPWGTFKTVKIVKTTQLGIATAWYLPDAGCYPIKQVMAFKGGGTDVKTPHMLRIGTEPTTRLFESTKYAETPPDQELVLEKQLYDGRDPNASEISEMNNLYGNPYKLHGELNHPYVPTVK
jgi:hypothetical protein